MTIDNEIIASRDRTRRQILLSVWIVVILALPLWWKTTRVYRAELPYDDVEEWDDWKACQPTFPIKINLHLSNSASAGSSSEIKNRIEKRIDSSYTGDNSKAKYQFKLSIDQSWSGSKDSDISDPPGAVSGTYDFYISPGSITKASIKTQRQGFIQVKSWDEENIVGTVAEVIDVIFKTEEKTIKQLVNTADSRGIDKVKDQLKAVKYAPGYQLTFSLFSGDASNGVREWKIQEAINAYLNPILRSLSVISDFTVESQVQNYASLAFKPHLDADHNENHLTPDTLPNFINAAEWSLASTVTSLPSLNFLIYVPSPEESPLLIKNGPGSPASKTNSFLIPRWGGIVILNRDSNTGISSSPVITEQELQPVMKIFLTQLRDLLGLSDLSAEKASFPIIFHKSSNEVPTAWELDSLMRRRSTENLVDSLATLRSLTKLVAATPNMVVLDHIQKDVVDALNDVGRSCKRLSEQEYVGALVASRDGLVKAETAFFDPTMVSMLYFPDEHKYAIYMPLFVPISVPLILTVLRELKKLKSKSTETGKVKTE